MHACSGYAFVNAGITPPLRYHIFASLQALLPLLFRKRSRSANLLTCKRVRDALLSLPTFSGLSTDGIAPSLLLFRKKARLLRLCLCKRRHNASASLPTFSGHRFFYCIKKEPFGGKILLTVFKNSDMRRSRME